MLVIRKDQFAVLSEYMMRGFQLRTAELLRKKFPERTKPLSEEGLLRKVQLGVAKAAGYGISEEEDVQLFCECMLRFAQDFDTELATEWAGRILRDKSLDGVRKMRRIRNRLQLMDEGLL